MSQSPYLNQKPDDPSKPYVFISYARSDAPEDTLAAVQIEEALVAAKIHCFRDVHMPRGEQGNRMINEELKECNLMVLVVSPRSIYESRQHVDAEWNSFIKQKKTIFPFKIDATELPHLLDNINWIDAINDREKGLEDLLNSIQSQSTIDSPPNQIFDRFLAWYKSKVHGLDVSTNNLIDVFKDTFQSRFKSREELQNETEKIKSVEDLIGCIRNLSSTSNMVEFQAKRDLFNFIWHGCAFLDNSEDKVQRQFISLEKELKMWLSRNHYELIDLIRYNNWKDNERSQSIYIDFPISVSIFFPNDMKIDHVKYYVSHGLDYQKIYEGRVSLSLYNSDNESFQFSQIVREIIKNVESNLASKKIRRTKSDINSNDLFVKLHLTTQQMLKIKTEDWKSSTSLNLEKKYKVTFASSAKRNNLQLWKTRSEYLRDRQLDHNKLIKFEWLDNKDVYTEKFEYLVNKSNEACTGSCREAICIGVKFIPNDEVIDNIVQQGEVFCVWPKIDLSETKEWDLCCKELGQPKNMIQIIKYLTEQRNESPNLNFVIFWDIAVKHLLEEPKFQVV